VNISSNFVKCFQLCKADRHSLDFTFNRLGMNMFKTGSTDAVKDCQSCFAIDLPSRVLKRRQDKFILRYISTVNVFAKVNLYSPKNGSNTKIATSCNT